MVGLLSRAAKALAVLGRITRPAPNPFRDWFEGYTQEPGRPENWTPAEDLYADYLLFIDATNRCRPCDPIRHPSRKAFHHMMSDRCGEGAKMMARRGRNQGRTYCRCLPRALRQPQQVAA